ncbi:23S rRNA (uracil(1939)-C(5))-methyltransferase RlmD [Lactococcus termiticola]|uniref:TrmA family RNA methyltransferase n=1 Tax=Lactococcus termiticola TaxID=2169526 RepID=A0A2R5HGP2_9LACT|nr:23S rRNA (uracil(1939)-C(5))-methyltransferase RlmD [Lactococcus termiticola]GBG96515.1 TrmA family RNA methyltransferase [Lactococcus termiticola]
MITLKIGQKITLNIQRMGINGEGIASYHGRLIFVPYALPTEEVLVEITENARNFSRAKLLKVNKRSKDRVEPKDKVYHELSSSHISHLAYPAQLEFKRDLVRQALEKYRPAGWKSYELRPTIGMDNPSHYRNKLTYQVRRLNSGAVIAGLYKENSHHLVNLEHCIVQEELSQQIINRVCQLIEKYNLPVDDERKLRGIRTVMIRRSQKTGEVQMIFVSSANITLDGQIWPQLRDEPTKKQRASFVKMDNILSDLTEEFQDIVTIAVNHHPKKSSEIYGDRTQTLFNEKERITEGVLDYDFELSPRAFYQLNPTQANVLYAEAAAALSPHKTDRVIDAYCGVGTIGFAVAKKVKSVHGMDTTPEAIQDAKHNAKRLGLKNCHYETGRAEVIIPNWYKSGHKATALLVDPPRTGLDAELLETIAKFPPEKMVYVSCNVSTLAKDLIVLANLYKVEYIQSIDMFPDTARAEAVVKLTRKKARK